MSRAARRTIGLFAIAAASIALTQFEASLKPRQAKSTSHPELSRFLDDTHVAGKPFTLGNLTLYPVYSAEATSGVLTFMDRLKKDDKVVGIAYARGEKVIGRDWYRDHQVFVWDERRWGSNVGTMLRASEIPPGLVRPNPEAGGAWPVDCRRCSQFGNPPTYRCTDCAPTTDPCWDGECY